MRRTIATVLVALMLLLAGCASGVDSGTTGPNGETTAADGSTDSTGTVNMYVSDEVNAIDQFEHLNVTITKVGFQQEGDAEADTEAEAEDGNETEMETENETEVEADANVTANGSVDANATNTTVTAAAEASADADAEASEDGESGEWKEYDVEKKTIDLTKLQGANATSLGSMQVQEGNYSKVFVYVSEVNGTLKNGETVNVKLPSNKLQLNKGFTIESGESVDFVYDITVVTAGNSGKYILKPVVGESGTSDEVEINVVDDDGEDAESAENETADDANETATNAAETAANELTASFVGNVTAGSNATVSVTQNGEAVANASVEVNGEAAGTTNEDGELIFEVPEGSEEVEVTITSGDDEVELTQTINATAEANAAADDAADNSASSLTALSG